MVSQKNNLKYFKLISSLSYSPLITFVLFSGKLGFCGWGVTIPLSHDTSELYRDTCVINEDLYIVIHLMYVMLYYHEIQE